MQCCFISITDSAGNSYCWIRRASVPPPSGGGRDFFGRLQKIFFGVPCLQPKPLPPGGIDPLLLDC